MNSKIRQAWVLRLAGLAREVSSMFERIITSAGVGVDVLTVRVDAVNVCRCMPTVANFSCGGEEPLIRHRG